MPSPTWGRKPSASSSFGMRWTLAVFYCERWGKTGERHEKGPLVQLLVQGLSQFLVQLLVPANPTLSSAFGICARTSDGHAIIIALGVLQWSRTKKTSLFGMCF